MAHSDDTRRAVRASFVFDQLTLEASAALHQVPVPTARRWKGEARRAGDDWDKAQAAQLLAGGGIEEIARQTMAAFIQQVQATTTALQADTDLPPAERAKLLASLSDSFAKLMVSNRRLMPETDRLAVALDVIKRLLEFTKARYPGNAAGLAEMLEAFGEEVLKAYG